MRSLVLVALLSSVAHAGPSNHELAVALAKGDVAVLRAAARFPLRVTSVWFDRAACVKFAGDVQLSEQELPELVHGIAELQPRAQAELVIYGPGTPLWFKLDPAGQLTGVFGATTIRYAPPAR